MRDDLLLALFTAALGLAAWNLLATLKNTVALVELTLHLRDLSKKVEVIPKLEKDIAAIQAWKKTFKRVENI